MSTHPTRGQSVDITLHGVLIDDIERDHDDTGWTTPGAPGRQTPTYTVTINGAPVPDVRAFQVQLHSPEPPSPGEVDPRTEIEAHWGGDPELIAAAWEADRSALQHLVKHHENRAKTATERIRRIHLPVPGPGLRVKVCNTCRDEVWPCPTIRALGGDDA